MGALACRTPKPRDEFPSPHRSLQPLQRQPIPAEGCRGTATSRLPPGLFAAPRESLVGPLPRWRSPELAAGYRALRANRLPMVEAVISSITRAARRLGALASGVEASSSMAVAKLGGRN